MEQKARPQRGTAQLHTLSVLPSSWLHHHVSLAEAGNNWVSHLQGSLCFCHPRDCLGPVPAHQILQGDLLPWYTSMIHAFPPTIKDILKHQTCYLMKCWLPDTLTLWAGMNGPEQAITGCLGCLLQ